MKPKKEFPVEIEVKSIERGKPSVCETPCDDCDIKTANTNLQAEKDEIQEIIERIMTQHWDMAACQCWVCRAGRKAGCQPREGYPTNPLGTAEFGRVIVEKGGK